MASWRAMASAGSGHCDVNVNANIPSLEVRCECYVPLQLPRAKMWKTRKVQEYCAHECLLRFAALSIVIIFFSLSVTWALSLADVCLHRLSILRSGGDSLPFGCPPPMPFIYRCALRWPDHGRAHLSTEIRGQFNTNCATFITNEIDDIVTTKFESSVVVRPARNATLWFFIAISSPCHPFKVYGFSANTTWSLAMVHFERLHEKIVPFC